MCDARFGIGCAHESRTYVQNMAGEIIAWSCNQCLQTGECQPIEIKPVTMECEWCGSDYVFNRDRFHLKRFCSDRCYREDLTDRKQTGRPLSGRIRTWL